MRILLFTIFVLISVLANAQDLKYGFAGGLLSGSERNEFNGNTGTVSDSGFYIGFFTEIPITEKFKIQPEFDYGNIGGSGYAFLSARAKYYALKSFYLQAGPQLTYVLQDVAGFLNKAGADLSFGAGFDFSEHFHFQARYAFEITNRLNQGNSGDSSRLNWLQVGVGYSF